MIITYHTGACVKIAAGDTSMVFAPVSKKSKNFKPTNFGVDVVFIPLNHEDMNGAEEASRGDKEPFVIFGPGEYEVKDITAAGFETKSRYESKGGRERLNTVYSVRFDGLNVLYVGALGTGELPAEVLEMDAPDVLILPIGDIPTQIGEGTLDPAQAQKLAVKLEAKIVIPILHEMTSLKLFLKEAGAENTAPIDKLTIKHRDVSDKQNEVVVLSA